MDRPRRVIFGDRHIGVYVMGLLLKGEDGEEEEEEETEAESLIRLIMVELDGEGEEGTRG